MRLSTLQAHAGNKQYRSQCEFYKLIVNVSISVCQCYQQLQINNKKCKVHRKQVHLKNWSHLTFIMNSLHSINPILFSFCKPELPRGAPVWKTENNISFIYWKLLCVVWGMDSWLVLVEIRSCDIEMSSTKMIVYLEIWKNRCKNKSWYIDAKLSLFQLVA